jgi:hypothetical protein
MALPALTTACTTDSGPTLPSQAAKLSFIVQPSNATAGSLLSPTVVVAVQDASGNIVTNATAAVTLTTGANPGGGVLSGTTTVNPAQGTASFPGLAIDKAGAGYTLVASSAPLTNATSAAFSIAPGAATKLAFTVQPTTATAAAAITPAVEVAVQDAFENTVPTATVAVTLTIGANPGGGTLSGTTTADAVDGVASFPILSIDKAGDGYTLVASSAPLASTASAAFSIAPGPVTSVWVNPGAAILTFPSGSISVQLHAVAFDAGGNSVPTTVTWTTSDPTVASVDATGLVVGDKVGLAYVTASAGGKASTPVPIVVECVPPRCTSLFTAWFSQQPTTTVAGARISPPVQVYFGRPFGPAAWSGVASIVLTSNSGRGTLTGNADVGVNTFSTTATWSDLRLDRPGSGYTLMAIVKTTDGDVWAVTSAPFDITP